MAPEVLKYIFLDFYYCAIFYPYLSDNEKEGRFSKLGLDMVSPAFNVHIQFEWETMVTCVHNARSYKQSLASEVKIQLQIWGRVEEKLVPPMLTGRVVD